jgi:hypothetical protein
MTPDQQRLVDSKLYTRQPEPDTPRGFAIGDRVCLTPYHKDRRPTTIWNAGPESCVLAEPRGGYYTWNCADIQPYVDQAEQPEPKPDTAPPPRCRLCGKTALEIKGYLNRTNEFGVKGVWECVPSCHPGLREAALLCLQTNGGPIDGADTADGESYVMVRMDAFKMLEAAIKPERDPASA